MSRPRRSEAPSAGAHLVAIGASHERAPLAVRERIAWTPDRQAEIYRDLAGITTESLILSTCARTEIIALVSGRCGAGGLEAFIASSAGLGRAELAPFLHRYTGVAAARHLARVAAGLESMVPGEPEILGQVRSALETARARGTSGPTLEQLVATAIRAGRRARSETPLGRGSVSFPSAAVDLAGRTLGRIAGSAAVVVGGGAVGGRVAEVLARRRASVTVVNRTQTRAVELAERVGGAARAWEDLERAVAEADLVFAATAAPDPVLPAELVERAVAGRTAPLVLLDLSAPRAIDPQSGSVPGVTLRHVDHVRDAARSNHHGREAAVAAADAIVEFEVARFQEWRRRREVSPVITALVERGAAIRDREVARALAAGGAAEPALRGLAERIIAQLLDSPLRRLGSEPDAAVLATSVARLFELTPAGDR